MANVADNQTIVTKQDGGTTLRQLAQQLHALEERFGSKAKAQITAATSGTNYTVVVTKSYNT